MRGMHLSYKTPAKSVKDLHSLGMQDANTRRLFLKLCWLMDKHAVSADRLNNIDETSCRLFASADDRVGRRGVKQAQLQACARDTTTWIVAHWTCWCKSCTLARHTQSCQRNCGRRTAILELADTLDDVRNPGGEGEPWIVFWDTGCIHASASTLAAMEASLPHVVLCFIPPLSTCSFATRTYSASCPLRHRGLIRKHRDEQGNATTVIG